MKALLAEIMVTVRYSPRLYLAPLVGVVRRARREIQRVTRAMERERRKTRG